MQLAGRFILLVVCVLGAYSLPNKSQRTSDSCYDNYTTTQDSIDTTLVDQTGNCQEANTQTANASVVEVNGLSKDIQTSLSGCAASSSNDATLNCYVNNYDSNLQDLNSLTQKSRFGLAIGNETLLVETQQNCIMTAIMDAKSSSLMALNMLQDCLNNMG